MSHGDAWPHTRSALVTPDTQELVLGALDTALVKHIVKLFGVLMSDPSDEGHVRFMTGLNQAIGAHEELRDTLAPDECTGRDFSGSPS
jgi:hypothetical protein